MAVRKTDDVAKASPQYWLHLDVQDVSIVNGYSCNQDERTGLVILHQHLTPLVPCCISFWSPEYGLGYVPVMSLQDAMPDIVPYENVTDHVSVVGAV